MPTPELQEPLSPAMGEDEQIQPQDPPSIPPTDQPPISPISDSRFAALENLVREQNRQLQEQTREIEQFRNRQNAPPPPPQKTVEESRAEFYEDPITNTRKMIREELASTIAPLTEFVHSFKQQSRFEKLMTNAKNDPRFKDQWDPQIENYVEEALTRTAASGQEVTTDVMNAAVVQAVGMRNLGFLGDAPAPRNPNPNPDPAPRNDPNPPRDMSTPPHMRPTNNPPRANPNDKKKLRPLTEHEERLRRESKMTHEEFLTWQEMPATDVAFSDLGKPKGGK